MTPLPLVIVVKATVILAVAAAVDALLRRRGSAAGRHLVWAIAIAALLALPIASMTLPEWTLRIPLARPASATTPIATHAVIAATSPASGPIVERAPVASHTPAFSWSSAIVALYAGGVLLLLVRLAIEPIALRRLTRSSHEMTDPEWRDALDAASRELRVTPRVRLLQSAREIMPLTFGTLAPAIVLPASAHEWTADRRSAVLLHELAHVARRDCAVQRLTAFACALYWPHPGVWWAARRLRVERELACDDRVLAAGAAARDYAGHLLELAHSLGSAPAPATALGMARAKQLESRLLAVLDAARNRTAIRQRAGTLAIATAIVVLVPLAGVHAALVARETTVTTADARPDRPSQSTAPAPQGAQDLAGTWELRVSRDPGMAQVTVRTEHGNHGRSVRLDQIPGISLDQITATSATVRLPITRDAGTFNVDGTCRRGVCGGVFAFEPNQSFAAELVRRGFARPTPQQQMDLALADVGFAYLQALENAGYAKPSLADIVRAAQHGVNAWYLNEMTTLGYRAGTLAALTELRDHGVDPTYIKGMRELGYRTDSASELTRLRDHGIDPTYIRGMADSGFSRLPVDELLTARDHGVDPEYMKSMRDLGYRISDIASFVKTRDHGVDPTYVRGMASLGYPKLTIEELVRARDHGVDPHYIREMADAGYKGEPLDALIRMRDHGVDGAFVRRVQQKGVGHLSVEEIIQRRDRGMDDPDAAARAVAAQAQSLWQSIVWWLKS